MADIRDVIAPVSAMVPTAPTPALTAAYLYNARLFFRETGAWRQELLVTSVAGQSDYTLPVDPNAEVIDASIVRYDGVSITKQTREQMLRERAAPPTGRPVAFTVLDDGKLRLFPAPDTDGVDIDVVALLVPARNASEIPQPLADKYQRALEYGAAATLCWQMAMPWKDPDAAELYYAVYKEERDLWRSRAADGGMTGTVRRIRYGGL